MGNLCVSSLALAKFIGKVAYVTEMYLSHSSSWEVQGDGHQSAS